MSSRPMVSVVIPTYNQSKLLVETLETVFAQTFADYEVIVVNDGSSDDTAEQLAAFGDRINLINQANAGVGAARDRGIAQARGKYVALLDHDDLWNPRKLEIQTAFYENHPECSIVTVPWARSTDPQTPGFAVSEAEMSRGLIDRPLRHLARGNLIILSSAIMFNRERAAGLNHGRVRRCIEDSQFHIGLMARGPVGVASSQILMTYRIFSQNTCSEAFYFENGRLLLREMDRRGEFPAIGDDRRDLCAFLAFLARTAAAGHLQTGNRWQGLKTYLAEFPHQLREGRLKFLCTYPLLLCAPQSAIEKIFPSKRPVIERRP